MGSVFGSKKKNEEVVNRVDYRRLVRDAEAAGFNPLTALRNGGAAGFSITSQPVLSSSGQAIGGALNQIGDFISNFDPFEDKMREVQYRTMQAQLANLQADTALKGRQFMFDPPAVSGRRQVTAGPSLGSRGLYDQDGALVSVGPGSSAEDWESEYGEIAGEVEGLPRYIRDRVVPALTNPQTYGLDQWPAMQWPSLAPAPAVRGRPARPGQNIPMTYGRWNP